MQNAARYAAAIEVLDVWIDATPVERALTRWARGARYAGSKDRAALRDIVYGVLRRRASCAAMGGAETGRALILGWLRLNALDPDDVFTGVGHAPQPLTDAEQTAGTPPTGPHPDVPDWMLAQFDPAPLSDGSLDQLLERAPLWLRVNHRKTTPEQALAALAEDGISAVPHPDLPGALRVAEGERRLRNGRAYLGGLVEIQDLSPHWAVARLTLPQAGAMLDFCAGGGGKALALADRSAARVFAHDALPQRMADLPARAARAGVEIEPLAPEALTGAGPFDLIVTDVPCSGSGTWRRDPEAKWRLTPEGLADLTQTQAEILDQAAALVAQGGQLVYMTCSLFRAENDAQIDAFLARHAGWRCTMRHLDTPITASDGFFSAVLEPQQDSPQT